MSAFDKVLGQPYASRVLRSALAAGRPAQAYVFFGPSGCGKKSMARALARALFCLVAPGLGCRECSSCKRVEGNKHPDLFLFSPAGASFKVDQVRDLLREASMRPFEAPRRVFVIDKAELLTDSAGNALLKVLEEPNPSLVFVLVTTNRSRLLPTIASRCQALRFAPLPEAFVAQILIREKGMNEKEAKALAGLSAGSLRQAERLAGEDGRELKELAEAFLEAAVSPQASFKLNWSALAAAEKKRVDEILELVSAYLRELWVVKAGLPKELRLLAENPSHGGGLSPEKIQGLMLSVARAQSQIRRNANLPLVLDNLVLAA